MTPPSTPSARRPRPGPGRSATSPARPGAVPPTLPSAPGPDAGPPRLPSGAVDRRGAVTVGGETIRVPGFAAFFHRHPRATQRGGLGAVAAGIVLFVVAGVTTPLAVANTGSAHRTTAHRASTSAVHLYREALPPKVARRAGDDAHPRTGTCEHQGAGRARRDQRARRATAFRRSP